MPRPSPFTIAVINASTVLGDATVEAAVPALARQVERDFYPAWGLHAELSFVRRGHAPRAGAWWLVILDDSHQAETEGYHELTREGLPIGKVYAGTDIKNGGHWTVTASHELLEMLADPAINLTVFIEKKTSPGRLYAYEVCDACEDDQYAYKVDGVLVSDFVLPAWFDPHHRGGRPLDHRGHVDKPFQLLPGGYISVYDVHSGVGWKELDADERICEAGVRRRGGSRRERRGRPLDQWRRSVVDFA